MAGGGAWPGGVHGRERAWQEIRPLQPTVRILLECILVYCNFRKTDCAALFNARKVNTTFLTPSFCT